MTRTLTDRGQRILDSMPYYYANDAASLAFIDVCARELDRLEDMLENVQAAGLAASADDTYGLLSLWESLVGLPVAPSGVTVAARQAKVSASRGFRAVAGKDWIAAVTAVLGTPNWSHVETAGVQVAITVPFPPASYEFGTAQAAARRVTPAHLDITINSAQGFILGISKLGDTM